MRIKHGHNRRGKESRIYRVWANMIKRCNYIYCQHYDDYGGRGITVCDRWLKFENFLKDMGEIPPGLTIEREDNDKGYYKENCRWATRSQQQRNKRNNNLVTHQEKTQCLSAWAEELGINHRTLRSRFLLGWSAEKALTTSVRKGGR